LILVGEGPKEEEEEVEEEEAATLGFEEMQRMREAELREKNG